ncbi:MAG: PorT family protein [Tannerellaceae bacterium]|jgi:hypothetical protein|nr:PorT family protein [Tannerellaceae bacterium]
MKKNRKVFMGVVCMMVALSAQAQLHFGIKGGLNISSVKFSGDLLSAENVTGFHIGPLLELMVPYTGIGLDAAVLYSQKGLYTHRENISTDYIDIPVNLKWKVGLPVIKGYLSAGPYASFCVSGSDVWEMPGNVQTKIENRTFAAGLNLGAGVEVFGSLQVGFTYGLGLTNDYSVSKLGEIANGKSNLMSVTAALLF